MKIKNTIILKTVIKICFIFACLFGYSQIRNSDFSSESIGIDVDNLKTNGIVYFSDIFDSYEIIPLETTSESLIGKINSIRFIKDKIIVLDRSIAKTVFLFDINGKFITKIGRIGKGPGEYLSPSSISADEAMGIIAVYDGRLNSVLLYGINGDYIKSIQLKSKVAAKSIELYKGEIYISNFIHDLSPYLLYSIDLDGDVTGEWFPNTYPKGFKDNSQISPGTIFFKTDKNLRFRSFLMNTVYSIESHSLKSIITLNSNKELKQEELVKIYDNSNSNNLVKLLKNEKLIGISGYSEINDLVILEYLNHANKYVLFYDRRTGAMNSTKLLNFQDDMTNFSGKIMGFFHTSYEDKLIAPISGILMDNLIEKLKKDPKLSSWNNLKNLTHNDNPCIVMYKCRKTPLINCRW